MDNDDAEVTYTVKELLSGIKKDQAEGFTRIETAMSGKADKADVARMEARLDSHATAISELQQERRDRQKLWTLWTKLGAVLIGAAAIVTALAEAHVI